MINYFIINKFLFKLLCFIKCAKKSKTKLEVVLNLAKLRFTAEQIAQSLNLPLDDVEQFMSDKSEV